MQSTHGARKVPHFVLLGHDEVQQGPELLQGVLQRRPCDQQPVVGLEVDHGLVEERVVVLQSVRLVHTDEGPVHTAQKPLDTHRTGFKCINTILHSFIEDFYHFICVRNKGNKGWDILYTL